MRPLFNFSSTNSLFWIRVEQQKWIFSIFYLIWSRFEEICKLLTTVCIRKIIIVKVTDTENFSGSLPIPSILKKMQKHFFVFFFFCKLLEALLYQQRKGLLPSIPLWFFFWVLFWFSNPTGLGWDIYFLLNHVLFFQMLCCSILIMARRCSQGSHLSLLKKLRLLSRNVVLCVKTVAFSLKHFN